MRLGEERSVPAPYRPWRGGALHEQAVDRDSKLPMARSIDPVSMLWVDVDRHHHAAIREAVVG
jgi:hypothetical protein